MDHTLIATIALLNNLCLGYKIGQQARGRILTKYSIFHEKDDCCESGMECGLPKSCKDNNVSSHHTSVIKETYLCRFGEGMCEYLLYMNQR